MKTKKKKNTGWKILVNYEELFCKSGIATKVKKVIIFYMP